MISLLTLLGCLVTPNTDDYQIGRDAGYVDGYDEGLLDGAASKEAELQPQLEDLLARVEALESGLSAQGEAHSALAADVSGLQTEHDALDADVSTLESEHAALDADVDGITTWSLAVDEDLTSLAWALEDGEFITVLRDDGVDTIRISEANLQIVNGTGATHGDTDWYADDYELFKPVLTGEGNLIIGYDEDASERESFEANDKGGSHNLVIGSWHSYPTYGAIVHGLHNEVSSGNVAAIGGNRNALAHYSAVAVGGTQNISNGWYSATVGGTFNTASGSGAAICGGHSNTASGDWSGILGGQFLVADEGYESQL